MRRKTSLASYVPGLTTSRREAQTWTHSLDVVSLLHGLRGAQSVRCDM